MIKKKTQIVKYYLCFFILINILFCVNMKLQKIESEIINIEIIKKKGKMKMEKSKVYFTKEINPEQIVKIYETLGKKLTGKVAVKLHSGEQGN